MANEKSGKKRLILLLVAVVLLGGIGFGAKVLWKRGKARETVRQRAERAFREGKFVLSADLSREVLRSEPDSVQVRRLLLAALWQSEQFDAAESTAQRYFEEGAEHHGYAARTLFRARMRKHDLKGAELVARQIADTDEETAFWMMAGLRDYVGVQNMDAKQRLEAAVHARNLKSISERDSTQAEALIMAATIHAEVADLHPQKDLLLKVVARDLKDAEPLAIKAAQAERAYEKRLALGRIRVLSRDETVAEDGARLLRRYVKGRDRSELAILALASYHARKREWTEAMDLIREIKDPIYWMRSFWVVRGTRDVAAITKALEMSPFPKIERQLLRAETLLRFGDDAGKAEGRGILETIVADSSANVAHVRRALLYLALRVGLPEARAAAAKAKLDERDDAVLSGFVAGLLMASVEDRERGLEMVRDLASQNPDREQEIMGGLGVFGGAAVQSFVDEQIALGGENAFQYRLRRAVSNLARARTKKGTEEEQALRKQILGDVRALLADKKTTKMTFAGAFGLAVQIGEVELAGQCAARAMVMEGSPENLSLRILLEVARLPADNDSPRKIAAGIRTEAEQLSAKAYLGAVADAIENRVQDLEKLANSMEAAGKEKASALLAYEVAAVAAYSKGDLENAARLARFALKVNNQSLIALESLGAAYNGQKKYDDVLTLWSGFDELPEVGYLQTVSALMNLDRKDEALKQARAMKEQYPYSALAHNLLARVYLDRDEKRKALSVLNMAPQQTLLIQYQRAELLSQLGDHAVAEQIYVRILNASRFTEWQAWIGYKAVLTSTDRDEEFLVATDKVLKTDKIKLTDVLRGRLRHVRGSVLEGRGDIPEALAEYEIAIGLNKDDWQSLNNAAWHIAALKPRRIATAKEYIERALKAQPDNGVLRDTAAEIHARMEDYPAALREIDVAIAKAPKVKTAKYKVHKARILLRSGDKPGAEKLLRAVIEEHEGDPAIKDAQSTLWEIEGERERKKKEQEEKERKAAEAAKKKEGAASSDDSSKSASASNKKDSDKKG